MISEKHVYIVDYDKMSCDAIATLLSTAGFRTKGFSSVYQFIREAQMLAPGCLVSDVSMPEMDGLTLLTQLKALRFRFPVVFLTGHGDIKMAVRAIKSGAADFVEKPYDEETILAAVRRAQEELDKDDENDELAKIAAKRIGSLSSREYEVLEHLVGGQPNKAIAHDLAISPRTVEFHRSRLMAKMQAASLSELVRLALMAGIKINT